MSALQEMLDMQLELQKVMPPKPDRATDPDLQVSCEFIKDNVLAAEDELHELLNETGWKPWSSSWHINIGPARREWIDAWHFMMNLANKLGMTEQMILSMYVEKHAVNAKRQQDGYDGVSTKCPACKRELDTPGALKLHPGVTGGATRTLCSSCGYSFSHVELACLAVAGVVAPEGP